MIILRAIKHQNNNIKTTTSNMTSVLINLRNEYIELNREIMSGTRIGGQIYNTCLNEINKTESGLNDDMLWDTYEEKLESYLVLFEITKELLKSKSFDDFFENLMYSLLDKWVRR